MTIIENCKKNKRTVEVKVGFQGRIYIKGKDTGFYVSSKGNILNNSGIIMQEGLDIRRFLQMQGLIDSWVTSLQIALKGFLFS